MSFAPFRRIATYASAGAPENALTIAVPHASRKDVHMNRLKADPSDVIEEWAGRHLGYWQAAQRHLARLGRGGMVIVSVAEESDLSIPASTFLFWDYHVVMPDSGDRQNALSCRVARRAVLGVGHLDRC